MRLVVLAPEALAVLKEYGLEIFAGIVNLDVPENRWVTLYLSETLVLDAILGKLEDGFY
jgi:hypothetical protein